MQRLTHGFTLAIASLTVVGTTVAAQTPSLGTAETLTVPIPGAGITMTLPSDWRVWTPADPEDDGIVVSEVLARQTCDVSVADAFATAQAAADDLVASLDKHDIPIIEQRSFEPPVGTAVSVSYHNPGLPDEPRYTLYEYRVTVPGGVLSMTCTGADPPPDRWRSIVESLTAGPERPSAPLVFDPRVDVPASGLAVTFPSEWLVRSWGDWPGLVLGGDFVLRAQSTVAGADCWLEDDSAMPDLATRQTPDDWRQAFADAAALGWGRGTPTTPGQHPSEPHVTPVTLPSGPALRADWQDWAGMPATAWVFQAPDRAVVLLCRASDPPADGWRSIAETFEFLTEEG